MFHSSCPPAEYMKLVSAAPCHTHPQVRLVQHADAAPYSRLRPVHAEPLLAPTSCRARSASPCDRKLARLVPIRLMPIRPEALVHLATAADQVKAPGKAR